MIDRLTSTEAAKQLHVTPRTLRTWRKHKKGPAYLRVESRIWYTQEFIDQYLASRKVESDA